MPANQLIHETSPYLLQHAHNPVSWYPWGPEALERARREDKPIFLSIGYAACHWCHVMEHESFENDDVAGLLNRDFIAIKVDREERPDLDEIYMTATMLYTGGHGGWPMSVWLTPSLKPIYAGTYFPPDGAYGRPGFKTILGAIAQAWKDRRTELETQAQQIVESIAAMQAVSKSDILGPDRLAQLARSIAEGYDFDLGGLSSGGNKFPPSMSMDLLLRQHRKNGDHLLLSAVEVTLERMANGGIYDHLGGGMHRYATDARWLVPHFEKMLYDQALVSSIYLDGYQVTGRGLFADRARGILDYVLSDLQSPEGGFYSSEDADSEGLEGKFYIWTQSEVREILGEEDAALFASHYDISEWGNWQHPGDEHVPHGPKNILQVVRPVETIAKLEGLDPGGLEARFVEMRRKMLAARSKRVRPGLDDKILCGWNGLAITALAKAAAVLDEERYATAGRRAAEFILANMQQNGRLLATWGKGRARHTGYLTDYAFLIEGLLRLYEYDGDWRWALDEATRLTGAAIEYFWDAKDGGFFFTASDHEALMHRTKVSTDSAIPSGNSVMLHNLQRLAVLLHRQDLRDKAAEIMSVFGAAVERHPFAYDRMLAGIDAWHDGFAEIAILGPAADPRTQALVRTVHRGYLPNKIVVRAEASDQRLPLLAGRTLVDGRPTAYVCRNYTCQKPVTSPDELAEQLGFAGAAESA